jgi:hypothetical protein
LGFGDWDFLRFLIFGLGERIPLTTPTFFISKCGALHHTLGIKREKPLEIDYVNGKREECGLVKS